MPENISPEHYQAEINMLNHEVYELKRKLAEKSEEMRRSKSIDRYNPFENPTDYKGFGGDYLKIQPRIQEQDYEIPLEPDEAEYKKLRRLYSAGGFTILFRSSFIVVTSYLLTSFFVFLLMKASPGSDSSSVYSYVQGSSIFIAINMLVHMIFNTLSAFIGLKIADVKPVVLVRTHGLDFKQMLQYCMSGLFIWTASMYVSMLASDVFGKYNFDINTHSGKGVASTGLGFAVMVIYTCIIAPITEEMLFRGALLRIFAKTDQRFGIIVTALLFGLSHHNIPQFILAASMGVLLGHITLKHSSIVPSVLVHIFVNSSAVFFDLMKSESYTMNFIIQMIMTAAGLFGFIMFLSFEIRNHMPIPTPYQSRRGAGTAAASPMFATAFVAPILYTIYLLFSSQ